MLLEISEPAVIHDSLGDEVVAIHYETGKYYCITGSGARTWGLLSQGARSREALVERAAGVFPEDGTRARQEIDAFIGDLIREGLVVVRPGGERDGAWPPAEVAEPTTAYVPPRLQLFDDMRQFLLQDPVHNIERAQWPPPAAEIQGE